MADIFHLDKEQRYLVDLLDNEDNLTGEERQDLEKRIDEIVKAKGNKLPVLFDAIEYLAGQNNHAQEKVSEIQAMIKKNKNTIDRLMQIAKHIFASTGQTAFQIGHALFKTRKLPKRLEIDNPDIVSDG
ncbi:MAG: hypothetical protein FJ045_02410, partial [Crenarchaeota archaeon]|nr:hypothetical protein [Thermoproteota archaeon]